MTLVSKFLLKKVWISISVYVAKGKVKTLSFLMESANNSIQKTTFFFIKNNKNHIFDDTVCTTSLYICPKQMWLILIWAGSLEKML